MGKNGDPQTGWMKGEVLIRVQLSVVKVENACF